MNDDCITAISDAADNAALMPVLIGAAALVVVGIVLAAVAKRRRGAGAALVLMGAIVLGAGAAAFPAPAYAAGTDCPTASASPTAKTGELVADVTQIRHAYDAYLQAPTAVQMTSDAGWAEDHPLEQVQQLCQGAYTPPAPLNVVLVRSSDSTVAWSAPLDVSADRMTLAGVPEGEFVVTLTPAQVTVGDPAPEGLGNAASLHWVYEFTDCVGMTADFGPDLTRGTAAGGYDGVLRVTTGADDTALTVTGDGAQQQLSFTLRAA